MCREFSCIITRNGKVYSQKDNASHTQIAIEHALPEDGKAELERAKVEVVPIGALTDMMFYRIWENAPSFDTWTVVIDEESIPGWLGDRHYKAAMAAALKWWKSREIKHGDEVEVSTGSWWVFAGSPKIKMTGGHLHICYSSYPDLVQVGGALDTHGNSYPRIEQTRGISRVRDSSSPRVHKFGGGTHVWGSGSTAIKVHGGWVKLWDGSYASLHVYGGEVNAFGRSHLVAEQHGGYIGIYEQSSATTITQHSGEISTWGKGDVYIEQHDGIITTYNSSKPNIVQHGGEVKALNHSAPNITNPTKEITQ